MSSALFRGLMATPPLQTKTRFRKTPGGTSAPSILGVVLHDRFDIGGNLKEAISEPIRFQTRKNELETAQIGQKIARKPRPWRRLENYVSI